MQFCNYKQSHILHKSMRKTTPLQLTKVRSSVVVRSSKSPEQLHEMMLDAMRKANYTCSDPSVSDNECAVMWDKFDDLNKAYSQAVDDIMFENMKKKVVKPEFFLLPKKKQ
jgi:hypothetical protein